jgi:DNA-binding transcriptional ArsR family regulator
MDTFSALAEPRRRDILELLAGRGKLSATEISDEFQVTNAAISQHLKILREAKLIQMEKHAQWRIYQINLSALEEMEDWTKRMRALWEVKFNQLEQLLRSEKQKDSK